EAQESERRTEEINLRSKTFVEALDVDEMIAHLLIAEGFTKIEEVAYIDLKELSAIEGFDTDLATELQKRAKVYLEAQERHLTKRIKELKLAEDLIPLEGLDLETLVALGEKNIKTLDDLADLATDELLELLPNAHLTEEKAQEIIMAARAHWFEADKESTES
ncbi:MAG: transcription termination/antitermination protein NusA, partial [Alphaproteobacteria bacterium]|nr:transcription termination/antitermination protein NusA [Alphaproteobacteria bacterium]